MVVALVFVLARNIVKLVVERRARPSVRPVPRQARRAADRHDAGAGDARARRRQRTDPHERGALVQRADGRDPLVGERDRRRLLPGAAAAGVRPRRAGGAAARRRRPRSRRHDCRFATSIAPEVSADRVQVVQVYRVVPGANARRRGSGLRCRGPERPAAIFARRRRPAGRAGAGRLR